jgi:hypothetical protein
MTNWYFQHSPSASDIGRMGAQALNEKRRAPIRAKADEMRAKLGMEPIRWGKG